VERLERTLSRIQPLDPTLAGRVQARLDALTKPQGSLGRLEELALRCALITGQERPQVNVKVLFVLCADHGVCAEGVSAYPRQVTAQMVHNFLRGGAAITVLARQLGITVQVVDLGVDHDFDPQLPDLIQRKIGCGTANLAQGPAMIREAAVEAVETGIDLAEEAVRDGVQLLGVGEMGTGNSTAAAALLSAFSGIAPEELTGTGTGIDETTRHRKVEVVRRALACNQSDPAEPLGVLPAWADTRSPASLVCVWPARRGAYRWSSTGLSRLPVRGLRARSTLWAKTVSSLPIYQPSGGTAVYSLHCK
jgi:nicotinate-nucleotide--dimethylbenzimidazole phosphoribosyltransferase